jgi:hypothetical protein
LFVYFPINAGVTGGIIRKHYAGVGYTYGTGRDALVEIETSAK